MRQVKNTMQFKAMVKKIAKDKHISAQLVLQNYMLERLLERISLSAYKEHFILKGGFLIAAMMGLDTRATMDMDATIKGIPVNEETVRSMFEDFCRIDLPDEVSFTFKHIGKIREGDDYNGYRVALTANQPPMAVPLKLDITTGDRITPREMEFSYPLLMEERCIRILAYTPETVLAEKLETVISRGDQNTRPRDYYDIFILSRLRGDKISHEILSKALISTAEKRGSGKVLQRYREIMSMVKASSPMQQLWKTYQQNFSYAQGLEFDAVCDEVINILSEISKD